MKNLEQFCESYVNEATKRPKDELWPDNETDLKNDPRITNAVPADDVDLSKVDELKPRVSNGKRTWQVDAPMPGWEKELAKICVADMGKNERKIAKRMDRKFDFMALGEAGWAKTSIIKQLARKHGYHVITVYLDKAVPSDLGGIPVPVRSKNNELYMDYSIPGWALEMVRHPNNNYLLFFDEMNQAQPDVLNALMPIILEHVVCGIEFDNFFVGAAGNLAFENDVQDLNGPLYDRVKPVIKWDVHTDESWDAAFKWIHSEYDNKHGVELVNKLYDMRDYWKSPRDVARIILDYIAKPEKIGKDKYTDPEDILEELEECVWDQADTNSRTYKKVMPELADYISKLLKGEVTSKKKTRKANVDTLGALDRKCIMTALQEGVYVDDVTKTKYLITAENAYPAIWDEEINLTKETYQKLLRDMDARGYKVRFATNKDGIPTAKERGWEQIFEMLDGHAIVTKPRTRPYRPIMSND